MSFQSSFLSYRVFNSLGQVRNSSLRRRLRRALKKIVSSKPGWFVYIIQTKKGQFYTGITTNLERRFAEHQRKSRGAKFFSISRAERVVFQESHPDRSSASRREVEIKRMTRQEKLALLKS